MHRIISLLIIFLFIRTGVINATGQHPDLLIEGCDTFAIFSNPLEQYFKKKRSRELNGEELKSYSTACYKGYIAIWRIQNDSLFLLSVEKGCYEDERKYFDLLAEFGSQKVFAKWFSGTINSPRGELLEYIHQGYASVFEKNKYFSCKKGIIISNELRNNVIYDSNRIFPGTRFIIDTIRSIIISNLDQKIVETFSDSSYCWLNIEFDENGIIDSISNDLTYDGISAMEDYLLHVAISSLKDFPALMKVNHERYNFRKEIISFDAYCLKHPKDKEYGCRY